jgi:hypothetical protein
LEREREGVDAVVEDRVKPGRMAEAIRWTLPGPEEDSTTEPAVIAARLGEAGGVERSERIEEAEEVEEEEANVLPVEEREGPEVTSRMKMPRICWERSA